MFNFEKLTAWNKAMDLAELVYRATNEFPESERFGFISQMRRAGVSVPSNVAEGSSRSSPGDNARFVEIAAGSLFEVVTQASLARRLGFLPDQDFQKLYSSAEEESRILSGLRRSLIGKQA